MDVIMVSPEYFEGKQVPRFGLEGGQGSLSENLEDDQKLARERRPKAEEQHMQKFWERRHMLTRN